jgi:hypothetical protein
VRVAVAPLPLGNQIVTATGCSPTWAFGPQGDFLTGSYFVAHMALDASYIYMVVNVGVELLTPTQVILRAPR